MVTEYCLWKLKETWHEQFDPLHRCLGYPWLPIRSIHKLLKKSLEIWGLIKKFCVISAIINACLVSTERLLNSTVKWYPYLLWLTWRCSALKCHSGVRSNLKKLQIQPYCMPKSLKSFSVSTTMSFPMSLSYVMHSNMNINMDDKHTCATESI